MIKKEVTMNDGQQFLVGIKEIGSDNSGIECHILTKGRFFDKSIFSKTFLKGMHEYKYYAHSTIIAYLEECQRKEKLLKEQW